VRAGAEDRRTAVRGEDADRAPAASSRDREAAGLDTIVAETRKKGGKNEAQISVVIRRDSNVSGTSGSNDALVSNANVTVELRNSSGTLITTVSGTTNSQGTFTSSWISNLAAGTYRAEVTTLTRNTYTWSKALDPTPNDTDLDGDVDDDFDGDDVGNTAWIGDPSDVVSRRLRQRRGQPGQVKRHDGFGLFDFEAVDRQLLFKIRGRVMGANFPFEIAGQPVIVHTWRRFDSAKCIDEIILVVRKGMETAFAELAAQYKLNKPCRIVVGGKERQDSVWNGLLAVPEPTTIFLLGTGLAGLALKRYRQHRA
jgi:hypothetical protein